MNLFYIMVEFDKDKKNADNDEILMPSSHSTLNSTSNKYAYNEFTNEMKRNIISSNLVCHCNECKWKNNNIKLFQRFELNTIAIY